MHTCVHINKPAYNESLKVNLCIRAIVYVTTLPSGDNFSRGSHLKSKQKRNNYGFLMPNKKKCQC